MTYKLGKDGWPTDETVVDMRDREIESLRQQLAECQAREKVLRDALDSFYVNDFQFSDVWGSSKTPKEIDEALAMPSDSTALDTMLKAAELKGRRGLLNRLHKVADTIGKNTKSQEARDSIRNLAKELEETK